MKEEPSADCTQNVTYLDRILRVFDLGNRWISRNEADGKYYGITDEKMAEKTIAEADVLVNVFERLLASAGHRRNQDEAIP